MQEIFGVFAKYRLRMNIMQNGAISFAVGVDNKPEKIKEVISALKDNFTIKEIKNLNLLTIRHYNEHILNRELATKIPKLTQKTKTTIQVLCKA